MKAKTIKSALLTIVMGIIALLWIIPVYYLVINAFKPLKDVVIRTGAFPTTLFLQNFIDVWKMTDYPLLFANSFIITSCSVALIVLFSSMAGYKLARSSGKVANLTILYFLVALVIPFQSIMIPLVKLMSQLHLANSKIGIIILYTALQSPMSIYLYYGAVKCISPSLEESATIDGAGPIRTFFSIIFPLLSPMTSTIVILNTLWLWNDFLLPLVLISDATKKTIPLGTSALMFGSFMNKWNLGITSILLATIPMLVVYLVLQKYIVKGITEGSVKG
ncbi:MAG: carbohydrate ABC transporter permease [Clostridia bacterium]